MDTLEIVSNIVPRFINFCCSFLQTHISASGSLQIQVALRDSDYEAYLSTTQWIEQKQKQKTYNSQDSHVVTHHTTN